MKELVVWLIFLAAAGLLVMTDLVPQEPGRMSAALLGETSGSEPDEDRPADPPDRPDPDPLPVDDPPPEPDDPPSEPDDPPVENVVVVPDGAIRYVLRDAFLLALSSIEVEGTPARVLPAKDRYDLEVRTAAGVLRLELTGPRELVFLTELPARAGGTPLHPALLARPAGFRLRTDLALEQAARITLSHRLGHDIHPGLLGARRAPGAQDDGRDRVSAERVRTLLGRLGVAAPPGGTDEGCLFAVRGRAGPTNPATSLSSNASLTLSRGGGVFAGRAPDEDGGRSVRIVCEVSVDHGEEVLDVTLSLTYERAE